MTPTPRKKIYLAGFDVFRVDARSVGDDLVALCAEYGFEGLFPIDNELPEEIRLQPSLEANWIYRANVKMLREADYVMANINDFRSEGEPDVGTSWEMGFAAALEKPVFAYREDATPLNERVPTTYMSGTEVCQRGFVVEDFELPVNLMLACSAQIIVGGPRECLMAIKDWSGTKITAAI